LQALAWFSFILFLFLISVRLDIDVAI